jgi:SAM-dependent methyltransferase
VTPDCPEISDLIIDVDPRTLARRPVTQAAAREALLRCGNRRAAGLVAALPATDGVLDPVAVDRLLIACHLEIQRLSEEFFHDARVWNVLAPMLQARREQHPGALPGTVPVVDVGCGLGFLVRALALRRARAAPEVAWFGADLNAALVGEARRLAQAEQAPVTFLQADAFRLPQPGAVFLSTGVLHHFRGDSLTQLFAMHEQPETFGFIHHDFQPSLVAPFGAWLFHQARMRHEVARHDGVHSAVRAHEGRALLLAARAGAPGFFTALFSRRFGPFSRPMQALIGVRPSAMEALLKALGSLSRQVEVTA